MSNIGPIALEEESNGQVFLGGNMNQDSVYPESVADRIDDEVCKIVNYCEQKALQIILDNRVIIDLVVERLLDIETMDGDEFRELLSTYTILPDKNSAYVSKLT
jgi:cell division protease FtsH